MYYISTLGTALINGKMKPKGMKNARIGVVILSLLAIIFPIIIAMVLSDGEFRIMPGIMGEAAVIYLILISPATQRAKDYDVITEDNTFRTFRLFYKDKEVSIKHSQDEDGKFIWADDKNKLSCLSYKDGSHMSNFTKYRIINYLTAWMISYDLLSKDVTVTFEKLV